MTDIAETQLTLIKQEASDEYHDSYETEFNTQSNGDNSITDINVASSCIKTEGCVELPCECLAHQIKGENGESIQIKCESDIKLEDGDCHYKNDPYTSMEMGEDFQQNENSSAIKQ